jgi:hypothetical protein
VNQEERDARCLCYTLDDNKRVLIPTKRMFSEKRYLGLTFPFWSLNDNRMCGRLFGQSSQSTAFKSLNLMMP